MADRTVTDSSGRTWTCVSQAVGAHDTAASQGRDVILDCATPSVDEKVRLTVGWQWENMSASGLARLITQVSPVPRR